MQFVLCSIYFAATLFICINSHHFFAPGVLPSHSRHSSPSGHLTHSRSSSKGSVDEIMSQPKQKELVGSVRQKMLLDYSVYMARCVPQESRSPQRSPVESAESSPTAGKKVKLAAWAWLFCSYTHFFTQKPSSASFIPGPLLGIGNSDAQGR